ncbi:hypothetical protein [Candidatus Uabimicrobium amorphum]|uniref:Uncharacterized protein n=1 Tax=Uabimicrobium amorphum TaxID=2596890 RepID=A0A5S9IJK0_UABAM|nr:hypothetical protein [Candidatus Uabimicrobium amorphum]BBM82701.1 hypothetical protein UABAM_01044 [Candidatus Uabimicrobium amorphum]
MFHKFIIAILIFISGLFLLNEKKRFDQAQNAKNHQVYSLISKKDQGHVIVGNYYVDEYGEVVWL